MKKIALVIVAAATLFACKSDDDTVNGSSLEGTYDLVFIGGETPIDFNGDGTASANLIDEANCYQGDTMVFLSNQSGTLNSTSYADVTAVSDTDGNVSYDVDCIQEISQESFTWEISGNNITLTQGFAEVLTGAVDGNQITFTIDQGNTVEVEDPSGNGTATITEDFIIIYEKQ